MNPTSRKHTVSGNALLFASVVLTGLSAGFFATYGYSVTRALKEVDDRVYVEVFQAINATVRSAEFGLIFFGSVPALLLAIFLTRKHRGTLLLLGAALVAYLVTVVITFTVHVPMNNALALVDTATLDAAVAARAVFETRWNDAHTVRTWTVLIAFVLATAALWNNASTPVKKTSDRS